MSLTVPHVQAGSLWIHRPGRQHVLQRNDRIAVAGGQQHRHRQRLHALGQAQLQHRAHRAAQPALGRRGNVAHQLGELLGIATVAARIDAVATPAARELLAAQRHALIEQRFQFRRRQVRAIGTRRIEQHQPRHQRRMIDRELRHGGAAHRMPDQRERGQAQTPDQLEQVGGEGLDGEVALERGRLRLARAPVVDRDRAIPRRRQRLLHAMPDPRRGLIAVHQHHGVRAAAVVEILEADLGKPDDGHGCSWQGRAGQRAPVIAPRRCAMIASASRTMRDTSSAQVGMSWIRPCTIPADQMPWSGSPNS